MFDQIIQKQEPLFQQRNSPKPIITNKQEQLPEKENKVPRQSLQRKKNEINLLKFQSSQQKNQKSKFSQILAPLQTKKIQKLKTKPILLVNKIQQSRPQFKNSILIKQLAYDILLQTQNNTVKVKNCVAPTRPNSQIYKRLSKSFFENIKNGIDQCLLFIGNESGVRIQSSIGNQRNPGIFMIAAIAILDEKYKENHERFDAQFAFLEYRGQKMFDLINYTQEPLIPRRNDLKSQQENYHNIELGEHYVKVCTFLQFIKLFKIALFNNKERDIKTNKQRSFQENKSQKTSEYLSSFIMKVRIKKYDAENRLIFQQETICIDLDENCSTRNNTQKSQKLPSGSQKQLQNNQKGKHQIGNRTLLDFILIEINNSNPSNKQIHYHMVEKNLLLQLLKKYLRVKQSVLPKASNPQQGNLNKHLVKQEVRQFYTEGYLFIINSFTVNPYTYKKNIKFYDQLQTAIGQQWQALVKIKNTQKRKLDLHFSENSFHQIIDAIKYHKYASFKDLCAIKQFYVQESQKIITGLKSYRNLFLQYGNQKKNLTYNKNTLTAYQIQLIGKCVKSDNFKQFYVSKSYLALPRQIEIKTQKIRNQIKNQINSLKITQNKFQILKKKQNQQKKSVKIPQILKNTQLLGNNQKQKFNSSQKAPSKIEKTKFKLISNEQQNVFNDSKSLQRFIELKKYIYDYLGEIWSRILLEEQRTITEYYIFQQNFVTDIKNLKQLFKKFIKQILSVDETKIKYFNDEANQDIQNINRLMRSVHLRKSKELKYSPSNFTLKRDLSFSQKYFKAKNENSKQKYTLPKIYQKQKSQNIKQKSICSNQKQNFNQVQPNIIQIKGKVNFGSLLLNPKKLT